VLICKLLWGREFTPQAQFHERERGFFGKDTCNSLPPLCYVPVKARLGIARVPTKTLLYNDPLLTQGSP